MDDKPRWTYSYALPSTGLDVLNDRSVHVDETCLTNTYNILSSDGCPKAGPQG